MHQNTLRKIQFITFIFNIMFMTIPLQASTERYSEMEQKKYDNITKKLEKEKFFIKISNIDIQNEHHASTLLISCVDFRLRDETHRFMDEELMLLNDYDEMSFPGASLGLVNAKYPHWGQSINEIIGLLKELHNIKRVILLDHRGCGAYNLIVGKDHAETPEKEKQSHQKVLREAKELIQKNFPKLDVNMLLMGLDGVVERID